MMLLVGIFVFMLLRELRRNTRVPNSIWKGRGGEAERVDENAEELKTKMRLEKIQLESEKGRLGEPGGCCQEKVREMEVENSESRTAPTFLLEHSMLKERKVRKKAGKHAVGKS